MQGSSREGYPRVRTLHQAVHGHTCQVSGVPLRTRSNATERGDAGRLSVRLLGDACCETAAGAPPLRRAVAGDSESRSSVRRNSADTSCLSCGKRHGGSGRAASCSLHGHDTGCSSTTKVAALSPQSPCQCVNQDVIVQVLCAAYPAGEQKVKKTASKMTKAKKHATADSS